MTGPATVGIEKLETGITGLDVLSEGGLPRGRLTLVSGTAGSAKTVLASQFLAAGIQRGEAGVFVTFDEHPDDLRRNMVGLGWDIPAWERAGQWRFVDVAAHPADMHVLAGEFDFGAFIARIEHAARQVGASRVAIDAVGSIFDRFANHGTVRAELLRVAAAVRDLKLTAIVTIERADEYGAISRHAAAEFVADNVVILRNTLEDETRRRTLEILKLRGTSHRKGEYPFTVIPGAGIAVIPVQNIELSNLSTGVRIPSGVPALDAMCGGGFLRDSVTLVSGATGTGKTLMVTEFLNGGVAAGERCLLFAFQESRAQIVRNAQGWGADFLAAEQAGVLRITCRHPERTGVEDHLVAMQKEIEAYEPSRVAVDSLSALKREATRRGFPEMVTSLTALVKERQITAVYTSTDTNLVGSGSVTGGHISTITDTIILLRYVDIFGEVRRALTVLKMRGSQHDRRIREYTIDGTGLQIGEPFHGLSGVLRGEPVHAPPHEIGRLSSLFERDQVDPPR